MFRLISISTIAIAGVVHLIITPAHFSHAPAHGILFGFMGIGQLAWAVAFWRFEPSKILYWVGLTLSGGIVILWSLTQLVSVPFASEAEPIDWVVLLSKANEMIGFIALINLARKGQINAFTKQSGPKLMGVALLVALIAGIGFWGLGHLSEMIFPEIGHVGEHGPGHSDNLGHDNKPDYEEEESDHDEHEHGGHEH